MNNNKSVDVQEFIDKQPLGRFQIMVTCLCFLAVAIDGIDLGLAAYIAPSIREEWGLSASELAPIFVAGLLGMMLGSFLFGQLADRYGRRPILMVTVALFGGATLLALFADNVTELSVLRFIAGLGIGGATPAAATLTAEYAPARSRITMITIMLCGNSMGYALGGVIASQVIERFGWHAMLIVAGVAPLLLLPALWLWLPESMRYLALRRPNDQQALLKLARQFNTDHAIDTINFHTIEKPKSTSPVREILIKPYFRGTALIWTTSFMALSVIYLMSSWLPVIVTSSGGSVKSGTLLAALSAIGATTGGVVLGRLMQWRRPSRVLGLAFMAASVAIFAIGHTIGSIALVAPFIFIAGFCVSGTMVGVNGLAATYYPTPSRATGVSWASAIGRIGSMLGSAAGGYLLSSGLGYATLFMCVALPALIAGFCMLSMPSSSTSADCSRSTPLKTERSAV